MPNLFFFIFALSGFSGLIYESVWSHYLRLFLGHAAYAQTLSIAIFMGGMALGSWFCARFCVRWKNLLLGYALAEGAIGVLSLFFHDVFQGTLRLAYFTLFPGLASPLAANMVKWLLASLLILPQSILLGMTFPLMSGGLVRRFPERPGATLALLYFSNSLGAALGVLSGVFLLNGLVGLPGTVLTAGLINIALAVIVWRLQASGGPEPLPTVEKKSTPGEASQAWLPFLLLTALGTGAASFMYEIGWIRMLCLVLGSSTHAFELMLCSFILGLALGGLWVQRRIDSMRDPVRFLGLTQVAMGVLALSTLVLYGGAFEAMRKGMEILSRAESAYAAFNVFSALICMGIMLPATFCAGMTLPLITFVLMKKGHGEKSIGLVYAFNTLGAIAGVFFAVHWGMPTLGLKGLISLGSGLDILLGIALLRAGMEPGGKRLLASVALGGIIALAATGLGVRLDAAKMASGVYRHGLSRIAGDSEVLYHRDGKTSTVSLIRDSQGGVTIATNGKPDARINMAPGKGPGLDEYTMVMLGSLPLLFHPQAKTAANIGMGSGLTAHALLSTGQLDLVDTIEIEPAMVEAAEKGFKPRVERAFSDPRSRIHIDDAKAFFATHGKKYDLIVSEPSNPWVSGVSSLFSEEFYQLIRTFLNENGLLVQWIHLYEMNFDLLASVLKALEPHFSDYVVYFSGMPADLIIVAQKTGSIAGPDPQVFQEPRLTELLRGINIRTPQDLQLRRIGDKSILAPLFTLSSYPPNSDYFPILDLQAPKARFMRSEVSAFWLLRTSPLPILAMLDHTPTNGEATEIAKDPQNPLAAKARAATALRDFFLGDVAAGALREIPLEIRKWAELAKRAPLGGTEEETVLWLEAVFQVFQEMAPYLAPAELRGLWAMVESSPGHAALSPDQVQWFNLLKAVGERNPDAMVSLGMKLMRDGKSMENRDHRGFLLTSVMLGNIVRGDMAEALEAWKKYGGEFSESSAPSSIAFQFLLAHAMRY